MSRPMKRRIAALQPLWQALLGLGFLAIILDVVGLMDPPGGIVWVTGVVAVLLVAVLLLNVGPEADSPSPVHVAAPVRGTWLAMNTPGQQVPSHGTRALGQLCAVDLVQPDDDEAGETSPLAMRTGWRGSRPERFRCFGAPIYAVAEGVVVAVSDVQHDQRARNTWQSMAWFFTGEQILRVLLGWRAVIGNRVVIKHSSGVYSAYAHLKRGSARVALGDQVRADQQIAAVGNTGNTTQPHLHVQLMDRPRFPAAAGLPMVFSDVELGEIDPAWQKFAKEPGPTALEAMPRNGQLFRVGSAKQSGAPSLYAEQ